MYVCRSPDYRAVTGGYANIGCKSHLIGFRCRCHRARSRARCERCARDLVGIEVMAEVPILMLTNRYQIRGIGLGKALDAAFGRAV